MVNIKDLPKDFDWEFYLKTYPDLVNSGIKTEFGAVIHYLKYGCNEGRIYKNKKWLSLKNKEDRIKIFNNLCEKLLYYLEPNFPKIDKNSKNKSLIVETRWNKQIEFTIKNTIQKLGDGWGHIIFCGKDNFNKIKNLKKEISPDIEIINLENKKICRNSYNNLLLTLDFWKKINCEKVLIYQSDTFIFKEFDNSFLEWDYIGAPWGPSKHSDSIKKDYKLDFDVYFGNGGLSLRSVNAMIEILKNYTSLDVKPSDIDQNYEDLFFSYFIRKINKYNIPNLEICKKFSFEHEFYDDTFGCHQPFVDSFSDDKLFEKFLNKFKGVNVYGFGNTDSGLGQNMRSIVKSLKKSKILFNLNLPKLFNDKNYMSNEEFNYFGTNLILCNPDFNFLNFVGEDYIKDKYNIALWAWELPEIPNSWVKESKIFDEIWTISKFCEESFKKNILNKKIKTLNIPTDFFDKKNKNKVKKKLGFSNKFVCLFSFDYGSDVNRKNPFAVIESFKKAFYKNQDVLLIIKTHNCNDNDFINHNDFKNDRIILINKTLDREYISDLFNCADLYISLHRSEGSGLTIMEAINLEIPVVCTNYSGNLDFCDENCQLVNYRFTQVKANHHAYNEIGHNTIWAEPDINDASNKILEVYSNYDFFKEKIKITKQKMLDKFNLDKLSEFLEKNI